MNAEEILRRTFAEHESLAPDAEATLAGIHERLPNRRRNITVLAAAAVVVLIVAGFSVLATQRRPDPGPPASTPTPTAAPEETVSLGTTWLPPGTVRTIVVQRYYGRQIHIYSVTGADKVATTVDLQVSPGSDLTPTNGGDGPSELGFRSYDLTISGRPAREWRNDTGHQDSSYTVVVLLPDDRVAQVGISVPPPVEGRGAALASIGRRVAASLRLDRAEPIDTAFRPDHVPGGFVVRAVGSSDELGGTHWILGTPGAVPDGAAVTITQDPHVFSSGAVQGTVADGRTVQGRPTHVVTDGATVTLWIDLLQPGASIQITATHAAVPLAELYAIADGIRWTG